jgi:hypothetical protein
VDDVDNPDETLADTTPPDELGAARLPMTTAFLLASPMIASGDFRGSHEVLACTARLILRAIPDLEVLKPELEAVLETSDLEPEPRHRSEQLQAFFSQHLGPLPDLSDDEESLEPLDRMQGWISNAIALGAPAYNLGLHRGACEVYSATARMILGSFSEPTTALERLRLALLEIGRISDERQQAWVLRDAFDDVLRMRTPTQVRDTPMQERKLFISMAIQIGAPAYNMGDHRGCYEVYATVARLLLGTLDASHREAEVLRDALQKAAIIGDVTEAAWIMRRTFDSILRSTEAD